MNNDYYIGEVNIKFEILLKDKSITEQILEEKYKFITILCDFFNSVNSNINSAFGKSIELFEIDNDILTISINLYGAYNVSFSVEGGFSKATRYSPEETPYLIIDDIENAFIRDENWITLFNSYIKKTRLNEIIESIKLVYLDTSKADEEMENYIKKPHKIL